MLLFIIEVFSTRGIAWFITDKKNYFFPQILLLRRGYYFLFILEHMSKIFLEYTANIRIAAL